MYTLLYSTLCNKTGVYRAIYISLIFDPKHRLGVLVLKPPRLKHSLYTTRTCFCTVVKYVQAKTKRKQKKRLCLRKIKRYKWAKIRKRRNQKKVPTPKTEMGKNKLTIRHLYHENISYAEWAAIFPIGGHSVT